MTENPENLLDQEKESLLDEATSVEEVTEQTSGKKEILTEVTSVAAEEARTGKTIIDKRMTAEEIVAKATGSFIGGITLLERIFNTLSTRGKTRTMLAIMDLPKDGVPVRLQNDSEKQAFAIGQRIISDRFIITQHYIVQESKKLKAKQEQELKELKEKEENATKKNV